MLPRSPPGERASLQNLYFERQVESGVPAEEAQWRMERIIELRGASPEHERVYWNAKHRLGDSPEGPLDLVQDAAREVPPGKALDVAMGNGRHAIYLASLGWEATGYDFSPESVRAARGITPEDFDRLWQPFDLVRCEILDHGEDWFEGRESRTVKLIARKRVSDPSW